MKQPNFNWEAEDKYNEQKLQARGKQYFQILQHLTQQLAIINKKPCGLWHN